jgi:hypothetical protein
MASVKLNETQREQVLQWLCAGWGNAQIRSALAARGWPVIGKPTLAHYRHAHADRIAAHRAPRAPVAQETPAPSPPPPRLYLPPVTARAERPITRPLNDGARNQHALAEGMFQVARSVWRSRR